VLDDEHEVESTMDGKPFAATNFSHSFRSNLFMEHLGLDFNNPEHQELVADPIKSSFFHDVWDKMYVWVFVILDLLTFFFVAPRTILKYSRACSLTFRKTRSLCTITLRP
jgi:hypothetical protein